MSDRKRSVGCCRRGQLRRCVAGRRGERVSVSCNPWIVRRCPHACAPARRTPTRSPRTPCSRPELACTGVGYFARCVRTRGGVCWSPTTGNRSRPTHEHARAYRGEEERGRAEREREKSDYRARASGCPRRVRPPLEHPPPVKSCQFHLSWNTAPGAVSRDLSTVCPELGERASGAGECSTGGRRR